MTLKIEEFVRNDEIHDLEIRAGLYGLPAEEVAAEIKGLTGDSTRADRQGALGVAESALDAINNLINPKGPLGKRTLDRYTGWSRTLVHSSLGGEAMNNAGHIAEYRLMMELRG